MRKTLVVCIAIALSISMASPTQAAPKASALTVAFKTLLNTTVDSMDALEQKYEADVDLLDEALSAATKAANTVLAQEIQAATDLYSPQIASANQRLESAKTLFKNNSDLKIQQTLFSWQNADRVYSHP
jgi:hypothetical protein